ncbi:Rv3235 family protein [Actinoplanes sp. GCM10030250]|uniref:Rv3235 family protein n=1 Tax=Actinoplanes sp. GCM10030250 TaxID=3273376 RepID=UPI003616EA93
MPRYEPPFDDELSPQVWASARQLPLTWSVSQAPTAPDPTDSARSPATPPVDTGAPLSAADAPPVVAGASSDAKLAVRRFVHLCVEVLNGYRPAGHLRRLSLPSDAADVVSEGLAGARRVTDFRNASRMGNRRARRPVPVAVLKLRLCEPRPGAVEAAVALVIGDRTWAMALRMELHQQSWSATVLRLI